MDILRTPWEGQGGLKSTFSDPQCKDFKFLVRFGALDDEDAADIFESFDPPPALGGIFSTDSGDVVTNAEDLKEIVDAASGGSANATEQKLTRAT